MKLSHKKLGNYTIYQYDFEAYALLHIFQIIFFKDFGENNVRSLVSLKTYASTQLADITGEIMEIKIIFDKNEWFFDKKIDNKLLMIEEMHENA